MNPLFNKQRGRLARWIAPWLVSERRAAELAARSHEVEKIRVRRDLEETLNAKILLVLDLNDELVRTKARLHNAAQTIQHLSDRVVT